MLGYTEEELQSVTSLEVSHEEDRAATEAILAESAEGQRSYLRGAGCKDGVDHSVDFSVAKQTAGGPFVLQRNVILTRRNSRSREP